MKNTNIIIILRTIFSIFTIISKIMNSFGRIFRLSIYGESHSSVLGIIIDGCPAGIEIDKVELIRLISERKAGALGTTKRIESDEANFLTGVFNNRTTGSPINIMFNNNNTNSKDYSFVKDTPRPGHADLVATQKYFSYNDYRGGGAFSGRLTLALVAAGAIAKSIISNIKIKASIISLHGQSDLDSAVRDAVNQNNSIGGIIECRAEGTPAGLGEPYFDSFESALSHLIFSIPGVIGIEFGAGFQGVNTMYGSEFNDRYIDSDGRTLTNNCGGINGGITNGNEIVFRVAVKPTSSILKEQNTYNISENKMDTLIVKGRHDTCFALRITPIIEAVTAIVLADFALLRVSQINNNQNISNN